MLKYYVFFSDIRYPYTNAPDKKRKTHPNDGSIVNVRSLGPERKEALDVRLDKLEEARMFFAVTSCDIAEAVHAVTLLMCLRFAHPLLLSLYHRRGLWSYLAHEKDTSFFGGRKI